MKRKRIALSISIGLFAFLQTTAQRRVEKEPHHVIVLENQQVRVIELKLSASDTTLFHAHHAASVVVFLSASSFAIQNLGEPPVITKVRNGDVVYRDYDVKPVSHIVWSADQSIFRCLVIELK
ncbi:MAG TPA: hypothetical protein VL728_10735 [Cyclobacteriaceae bacterium]|jgi:hypothetical protein|nr:hypothetical protein [Cyclobacteriaceae bacterium]